MSIQPMLSRRAAEFGALEVHPVECCPLCDGRGGRPLHRLTDPGGRIRGEFQLLRCGDCGLVYVSPCPSDGALAALYDEEFYFSTGWSYAALASYVIECIQSRRRHRVERYARRGRLLDIGSGDGHFVHHMARQGWEATGIDFSPAALEFARRIDSGARFLQGSLDDHDFTPGQLDVVTLWQVLEHMGEPRPLLRRCHELLRPGGTLIAAVPNIDGLSSRLTGERWWGLDVPRHLVHFTPATLRAALEGAGFRVMHVRHRSLQYDPYALLHSSLDWVFTRRHFLSDFAKRHPAKRMGRAEFLYNLVALVVLAPLLAPVCLLTAAVAGACGRGGFIEVHARRE